MPSTPDLAELDELDRLAQLAGDHVERRLLCEVEVGKSRFPIHAYLLGNVQAQVPGLGVIGGVHGLERIGAQVAIGYMRSLVMRLRWDDSLHRLLETMRVVLVPLVNPGGLWLGTRANPNGVDLMRNAPVEATGRVPYLIGGQRLSAALPWYRGRSGAPMERESEAVCRLVRTELLGRPYSMVVDCHSGFGLADRLWFPFAHTRDVIPHLAELTAFGDILDQSLLHHRYILEPQSRQYLAHGDLWDHLYLESVERAQGTFVPMTLEMGSWLWVKKNPRQLFSRRGIFDPVLEHRRERVLRRHVGWIDFVARAVASHERWVPAGAQRPLALSRGMARWYAGSRP